MPPDVTPCEGTAVEMSKTDRNLTLLVRLLRMLRGWKQAEMATQSGIHATTLSLYESGSRAPNRAALERIANAAGVPMSFVDAALLPVLALACGSFSQANALPFDSSLTKAGDEEAAIRLAVDLFLAAPLDVDRTEGAVDSEGVLAARDS